MVIIIVVGYKSRKYLADCLSSIFNSTYKNFKVIFVDNDSNDGSIKYIEDNYKKVIILESKNNLGFAGGNNLGIKKALKLKADFLLFLNPDTIIDRGCLSSLIKKADKNTILQPLILLHENDKKTDLINTSGGTLNFLGFSYCSNYRKKSEEISENTEIPVGSGCALFCPVSVIKKIGFFDPVFFTFHEDVDFCWRARLFGYKILVIPNALVWHKYEFSRNKNKMFYFERNRLLFLMKNYSPWMMLITFPAMLINEILMVIFSIMAGWTPLKIKSYFAVFALLPHVIKERKRINKKEKNYHQLKTFINSDISFSEVKVPGLKLYNFLTFCYWSLIKKIV